MAMRDKPKKQEKVKKAHKRGYEHQDLHDEVEAEQKNPTQRRGLGIAEDMAKALKKLGYGSIEYDENGTKIIEITPKKKRKKEK